MKSNHRNILWPKAFWVLLFVTGIIITSCFVEDSEKEIVKPNFIIWVADDQYLESVGCYGGDPAQTPNIDKLASEGLRFTKAYSTSSICTPSRSALYTGMLPIKNGSHPNHSGLKRDIKAMPNIMRELGYRSALVGKTGVHELPTRPTNLFDWDEKFPLTDETIEGAEWSEKAAKKHRKMDFPAIREFIADDQKPFCLFVASSLPHGPELAEIENGMKGYPANNWKTDWQLGQYMKILEETGKVDNTVLIFVSDNGSNTPRSKYTVYEPGVHIPMIIRWPGHVKAGTTTDALVDFTDVMPTLMEIAGSEPLQDMDGKSLVPLMKGKEVVLHDDLFLSVTFLGVNDIYEPYPIRGVVTDRYKLIHNLNFKIEPPKGDGVKRVPEFELYDLKNDPKELVNLYKDNGYTEIRADLHERLDKWKEIVGDKGMETEYEAVAMFPDKIGHLKYSE
jgi:uncharacterized sulfatase